MVTMLERRTVSRIDHPVEQVGMNSTHRIRPLLGFGAWKEHDPFLALMEDWFPRGVFDRHPHRGIETVTYVLDGELEHYDNQGNAGFIRPGDAQWMTAGRGVIHNEIPAEGVTVHSLQLWVNLPAAHKLTAPRYQDLTAATRPVRREPGVEVRVFSGASGGVSAATLNYVPVTMVEVRLEKGATAVQDLPASYSAFVVVLEGQGRLGAGNDPIHAGDVAFLSRTAEPSEVALRAGPSGPLRALLYAGLPLGEPVVARGPFVMNTEQQIREAFADYSAGRFGA